MSKVDVHTPTDEYLNMCIDWQLPVCLMGGQRAMQSVGTTYLPQEPNESDAAYTIRLERSVLNNEFKRTVKNLRGRVFSRPISYSDDVPKEILEYNKNIDMLGNNADTFYASVFEDCLVRGLSHIHVDYPFGPERRTLAEEREMEIRPYCRHITAEQVIRAVPEVVNGKVELARVHIVEEIEVPDGKWGTEKVIQVRVLYRGYWEVYQKGKDQQGAWVVVDSGETSLNYIPLITIYGCRTGFMNGISPLQDLAYLNLGHWQSDSDQRNILHVARVPILFGTGLEEDAIGELEIGANRLILAPDGASLSYTEHTGRAIASGDRDLLNLEERMRVAALEPSMEKTTGPTATGRALDTSQTNSSLQDLALRLQDTVMNVQKVMADWEERETGGTVVVNRDFGLQMRDGSETGILLKARQNGSITKKTFLKEMKRRGLLNEDFDIDAEMSELEKEEEDKKGYFNEEGKRVVGVDNEEELDFGQQKVE